jgi:hypothetical protein
MVDLLERHLRTPLPVIPAKGSVDLIPRDRLSKNNPSNRQNKKYINEAKGGLYQASESPSETGLSPFRVKSTAPKAGIQCGFSINVWCDWIPAFAGMTLCSSFVERIFSLFSLQWNYWKSPGGRGSRRWLKTLIF